MTRLLLCIALILVAPSCAEPPRVESAGPSEIITEENARFSEVDTVLAGYHFYNWEGGHAVIALGIEGFVCLQGAEHARLSRPETPRHPAYVELVGRISERGAFGHNGGCAHSFLISTVRQDRVASAEELAAFGNLQRSFLDVPDDHRLKGAAFDPIIELSRVRTSR